MPNNRPFSNRWYILAVAAVTNALAFAAPTMCMPVLFKEISEELGLNLVEIGTIWGMISLGSFLILLIGGMLGDRFGLKRSLTFACFAAGLVGALRGLSYDFISLAVTAFLLKS